MQRVTPPDIALSATLRAILTAAERQNGMTERTILETSRGLIEAAACLEDDPIARAHAPALREAGRQLEAIRAQRVEARSTQRARFQHGGLR